MVNRGLPKCIKSDYNFLELAINSLITDSTYVFMIESIYLTMIGECCNHRHEYELECLNGA